MHQAAVLKTKTMDKEQPLDAESQVALLKASIVHLTEQCADGVATTAQLSEVIRSVERLGKQGHPVPDDLRKLKIDLVMRDERSQQAITCLKGLSAELRALIFAIDSALIGSGKMVADRPQTAGKRKQKGKYPRTGQTELRRCLVAALQELGGSANCNAVKDRMREMLAGLFLPGDLMKRATGEIVWENNTHWERNVLVNEGLLKHDSPRGVWELSEDTQ